MSGDATVVSLGLANMSDDHVSSPISQSNSKGNKRRLGLTSDGDSTRGRTASRHRRLTPSPPPPPATTIAGLHLENRNNCAPVLLIHAPQLSKAHFSSFPVSAQTSPLGDATTTTLFFFPIAVVDLAGDTAATAPPPPSLPRIVAG
uniref:Uncharacterized protein n=1 Tax=Oryza rufipogon TaxID=4529 RepID=A0A0E0QDK6_ORYRU